MMNIFKVYDPLCQSLLPFTQVNDASMFRFSDSRGLIGIKKGNAIIILIEVGTLSADNPMHQDEVNCYRHCCHFLRLFFRTDNEGKLFNCYDLKTGSSEFFNFEQTVDNIKKTIIEYNQRNSMVSLPKIFQRNNILSCQFRGKQIIIFDDHRTTLDVLYELYSSKQFEEFVPNLITFDFHEDCCNAGDRDSLLRKIGVSDIADASQRQFWSFTEFDISKADDDWISAAITLNLVKDVVIIGHQTNNNVDNHANTKEAEHRIYSIGHLAGELDNRGCLGDSMVSEPYYELVRDTIQYHYQEFDRGMVYPFVLDIDLDCFSADILGHTTAWPESVFCKEYVEDQRAYEFVSQLIDRASIITISREPGCCGGLYESNKILGYLDKYFFRGALGAIHY